MFYCLTETQTRILIAGIGLLGSVITFIAGYYLGKRNIRYQNFLSAASEFRSAFSEIIVFLDEVKDNNIVYDKVLSNADSTYDMIIKNIEIHHIAFINFFHYFSGRKAIRFKKTWEDYANPMHDNYKSSFDWVNRIATYRTKNFTSEREVRQLVRNKIVKLLDFAPTK